MVVDDLQQRINALKQLNLSGLRARLELLHARIDLEGMAETIARDTDVDPEVVLMAVHASWSAHIDALMDNEPLDQDVFRDRVVSSTRGVVDALVLGRTQVGHPMVDVALARVVELGQRGQKPPSVAAALSEVSRIVAGTR